jgi:hypothetical protein
LQYLFRPQAVFFCDSVLISTENQELEMFFVNATPAVDRFDVQFLVWTNHRHPVRNFMYLPTPIYERIPQFWFLLGLLFIATGLYLGFEFALSFWYIAVGFSCCSYGVGIFLVRLRARQGPQTAMQTSGPAEAVQVEPADNEPMFSESAQTE